MRGALQPLLASGKPILCLSLSPPISHAPQEGLLTCKECQGMCVCSAKAALSEALRATLKATAIGAVKLDAAYYEQFGPCGFKVRRTGQDWAIADDMS